MTKRILAAAMAAAVLAAASPAGAFAESNSGAESSAEALSAAETYSGTESSAEASSDAEKPEPDASSEMNTLHVGQTVSWQPYDRTLQVRFESRDPSVAEVSEDGTIRAVGPGETEITARSEETDRYAAGEAFYTLTVFPDEDGLYLSEWENYFYYEGKKYRPGELPAETERKLCVTNPELKAYLEDYLPRYQKEISDPMEAALTAVTNFGAGCLMKRGYRFDPMIGELLEDAKDSWMTVLQQKNGSCVRYSSLFAYLLFLSGLPCMQVESAGEARGHDWNLIEHDGYYYNLENHNLLVKQEEHFAAPPFTEASAEVFASNIYSNHRVFFELPGYEGLKDGMSVASMGRDLSEKCPVLMIGRTPEGDYRAEFRTLKAGSVPEFPDGSRLTPEMMIYRNMELDSGNEEAAPYFMKADELLQEEIKGLFR